jgi:hypothetical protein
MQFFHLLTILLGQYLVVYISCDESSSIRRKRRVATTSTDFITVTDIANYLSSGNQRSLLSTSRMDAKEMKKEGKVKKWPRVDFSMATDPPIVKPPPSCDDTSRSNAILSILRVVTPEPELLNTVTPQGMAFAWILSEDPAATTILKKPCDVEPQVRQRYALAVLYYATSGDSWTNRNGWLSLEDECQWEKITCRADEPTVVALALCKYFTVPKFRVTTSSHKHS